MATSLGRRALPWAARHNGGGGLPRAAAALLYQDTAGVTAGAAAVPPPAPPPQAGAAVVNREGKPAMNGQWGVASGWSNAQWPGAQRAARGGRRVRCGTTAIAMPLYPPAPAANPRNALLGPNRPRPARKFIASGEPTACV